MHTVGSVLQCRHCIFCNARLAPLCTIGSVLYCVFNSVVATQKFTEQVLFEGQDQVRET